MSDFCYWHLPLRFKPVFQTHSWVCLTPSYGSPFLSVMDVPRFFQSWTSRGVQFHQTHVGRQCSTRSPSECLHIIGIFLSFHMSTSLLITSRIVSAQGISVQCWVVFLSGKHHTSTWSSSSPSFLSMTPTLQSSYQIYHVLPSLIFVLVRLRFVFLLPFFSKLNLAKIFNLSSIKKIMQPV